VNLRRSAAVLLLASAAGFSAAETTAILGATSILSATAAPQIQDYLENAREVKAAGDVQVIALSIIRLVANVGHLRTPTEPHPRLLVSDGEIPEPADKAEDPWTAAIDARSTQRLEDHLLDNAAGYPMPTRGGFGWHGPYLDRLTPDPWGSRYAANVGLLEQPGGKTVIVVSAGPNRIIETPFEQVGLKPAGDDVVALVGRGQ